MQTKISLQNIIRSLRLPFAAASILPFVFGTLIGSRHPEWIRFICGLLAVTATHLSANLINDYFDSKSGVDWHDRRFFGFFGGSKLIQAGLLSQRFYLIAALFMAAVALLCVITLAILIRSDFVVLIYLLIIILSWQYSATPFQFSYRYLGEIFIFILFGPVTVMGGYFIQSGIFPDLKSFFLSLPFGFLTAAVLFANEVPDFPDDFSFGKRTWVNFSGPKHAYIGYYILTACAFLCIVTGVLLKYLHPLALLTLLLVPLSLDAAAVLKRDYADKVKLVRSSLLTIRLQILFGLILILGVVI